MKRLSVAVLVDEAVTKDADGNDVNAPRTQEEIDQIMDLVRKAVGYNVDRGDEVTVVSMPFTQTQDEIELTEPPPRSIEDWINLLWKPVLGLLCLLVLLGVMRSMKPKRLAARITMRSASVSTGESSITTPRYSSGRSKAA